MLAFTRIPGNAFSFWIRQKLRWSRGRPQLPQESKQDLFAYLENGREPAGSQPGSFGREAAIAREVELRARYHLDPLEGASTQSLYRKNLYLVDLLERSTKDLNMPIAGRTALKALDVGAQDWHYVFALERWLRHHGRQVSLRGVEVDGHGIYPDFRSRKDYALAYAAQTGNPDVLYRVGDFLADTERDFDIITIFYPFVTRHHLLLWGLPLRYFQPMKLLSKAADMTRPGGWLVVFTHSRNEHLVFLDLGRKSEGYELINEGPALSSLVDFHAEVADRHFSVWRRL